MKNTLQNFSPFKKHRAILDIEFQNCFKKIKNFSVMADRKEKLRIEQWLFKLSEYTDQSDEDKKIRNEYANVLFDSIVKRRFQRPFDKPPKEGKLIPLMNLKSENEIDSDRNAHCKGNSSASSLSNSNGITNVRSGFMSKIGIIGNNGWDKFSEALEGKHKRTVTLHKDGITEENRKFINSLNPSSKAKLRSSTRFDYSTSKFLTIPSSSTFKDPKPVDKTHRRESSITKRYLDKLSSQSQERKNECVSSKNLKATLSVGSTMNIQKPSITHATSSRFLSMNNESPEPKLSPNNSLLLSQAIAKRKQRLHSKIEAFLIRNKEVLKEDFEFEEIMKELQIEQKRIIRRNQTLPDDTLPLQEITSYLNSSNVESKVQFKNQEFLQAIEKSDENTSNFLKFLKRLKVEKENRK